MRFIDLESEPSARAFLPAITLTLPSLYNRALCVVSSSCSVLLLLLVVVFVVVSFVSFPVFSRRPVRRVLSCDAAVFKRSPPPSLSGRHHRTKRRP